MSTVIIGGGIIGLATAYYLSAERPPSDGSNPETHILDSSHSLLLSASGYAGGFLAKDWFSSQSASLGALSFGLHQDLAKQHDGFNTWGYAGTRTFSLSIDEQGVDKNGFGPRDGDDWLSSGTSRAAVAPESTEGATSTSAQMSRSQDEALNPDGSPTCFTPQPSGTLEVMAEPDTTAQLEPRLLCEFLLRQCEARGVKVHLSATPISLTTSPASNTTTELVYTTTSDDSEPRSKTLPCTNLIITAGAWTPLVFKTLFPSSKLRIPISPLAGTSLLARSPRYKVPFSSVVEATTPSQEKMCYAIYCSPMPANFRGHRYSYAPEAFARLGADARPEIWIGGLNHPGLELPEKAENVEALRTKRGDEDVKELQACFVQLCGKLPGSSQHGQPLNEDDLDILRQGLCFRPVSDTGIPVIGRIADKDLGGMKTASTGGVFIASGHGPWGISLSLGTGKVVSELILQRQPSADIRSMRPR